MVKYKHSHAISIYTGYTDKPKRRFYEHSIGIGAKCLKGATIIEFVIHSIYRSQRQAMRKELELKKMPTAKKKEEYAKSEIWKPEKRY